MGSVDGLLVNFEVRGRVMVRGVFSSEEEAKKMREKRVKTERSREVAEAMAV